MITSKRVTFPFTTINGIVMLGLFIFDLCISEYTKLKQGLPFMDIRAVPPQWPNALCVNVKKEAKDGGVSHERQLFHVNRQYFT